MKNNQFKTKKNLKVFYDHKIVGLSLRQTGHNNNIAHSTVDEKCKKVLKRWPKAKTILNQFKRSDLDFPAILETIEKRLD
ncbi:hypothetical protein LCGC14_3001490, partial [marine sediment metagenome]